MNLGPESHESFTQIAEMILKFIWKFKELRTKTMSWKKGIGGLLLFDSKSYL